MRIAIIGAGRVGAALAQGLRGKGHVVTLGVRDAGRPDLQAVAQATQASLAGPAEAAQAAEIVILALPWDAADAAVTTLGDLSGKIVIDCMNPIGRVDGAPGLLIGHASSGGETVAGWLPGARVIKTLNQVGAEIMADARALRHLPAMFMAGDDAAAKMTVANLLADLGFEPLDAGGLRQARTLEPLAMVWINQAILRGKGRHWAFTITTAGD
jgi:predicted dinucleotide-binding enzyme